MKFATLKPRIRILATLGFLGIFLFGYYFFFFMFAPASYLNTKEQTLTTFPALKSTDRIVVVAPHLDDESIPVGGLIAEARKMNIPVTIIFMTNGDGNYWGGVSYFKTLHPSAAEYISYGETRQNEALRSTNRLGVPTENVYFLGLPDQGLQSLLLAKYWSTPYTSPYTKVNKSPYSLSAFPNLPYTGKDSEAALTALINKEQPTLLFTSLLQDQHPDHAASGEYVKTIFNQLTSNPKTYLYLVHYAKYPLPRGINPSLPLLPPPKLANQAWESIPLSADIVEIKRQSVEDYVTQLKIPELRTLMRSLVRKNELVVPATNF